MTPETLRIDKTFAGIRIRVRSGTTDSAIREEIVTTLRWLEAQGDLDRLRMVQHGDITPLDVRAAFRSGDLDRLPKAGELRPLLKTVKRWLKTADLAEQTKRDYENALTYVVGRKKYAAISELPRFLGKYREKCRNHPPSFRLARAAALSFLRHTFREGRHHNLWVECSALKLLRHQPKAKQQYTPELCREVATRLGRNGAMWWAMCITGMNPKEYFVDGFKVHGDRVQIKGEKRSGRKRVVPLLWTPIKPQVSYEGFKTALQKIRAQLIKDKGVDVTPKSARDAHSQWMVAAGIPAPRRKMYRGHGAQNVEDVYEMHELDAYLEGDAEKMRAQIGEPFEALRLSK